MIQTLRIKNLALIESATLEFNSSLNVISGETGAGKSILLDGLSFVFGGRADKSLIRNGATSMKVEALFVNLTKEDDLFSRYGLEPSDEMLISRELDINGKNTCRINGELCSVGLIKNLCQELVDIHGQSEHLSILDNAYQLRIIDLFDKENINKLEKLNTLIDKVNDIDKEMQSLGGDRQTKDNLIDLYTYQIQEIEKAEIGTNELEELLDEKKRMQQFEKINESLNMARACVEDSGYEESTISKLSNAYKSINSISNMGAEYENLASRIQSLKIEAEDVADTLSNLLDKNVFDQEKFNYIDERIDRIKAIFRKYGGDYNSMQRYYDETGLKLKNLINSDARYKELEEEKEKVLNAIDVLQEDISARRKVSANKLLQNIQEELVKLSMPNAKIGAKFTTIQERYSRTGKDFVDFEFSANLGFEPKPLNKVVSGGEMSRVMLAYKIVVSAVDKIHTMIFDEIDTGLSGEVAMTVASYLIRLSKLKQIITISHLPQICAAADENIKVEKYNENNSTYSSAKILNNNDLFLEIGRLMGDDDINSLITGKRLKEKLNNLK